MLFVCCPLAFRLLSDCFLMAFRLLSDCFLFAFQCLSAYVPAVFRLLPSCFPIAVVCWLTAICFAAARRLLTSFHADPFRLTHACCQRAVPWHSGLYPVADRLFSGMMPQLSEASNIVYARDGLTPTNKCRHPAVRSCVGIICDGRRSPLRVCWGLRCSAVKPRFVPGVILHDQLIEWQPQVMRPRGSSRSSCFEGRAAM